MKECSMPEEDAISTLAEALVAELIAAGKSVATAESCTGGWIAKSITDIAGSSQCFAYGIVSYSNGAKESMLGVDPATLVEHGAVSEATVRQMAEGALKLSGADLSVAVSGIAGPGGGTQEKPLGTVWFAWTIRAKGKYKTEASYNLLSGDRQSVRGQSVVIALQNLRERLRTDG
jgi:nicotinamide-nucleotide amidase